MEQPEIIVKQAASGLGWRTAAIVILVAAGLAVGVRECEHKAALKTKQTALDSTAKAASGEREKRRDAQVEVATLGRQLEAKDKEKAQREKELSDRLLSTQVDLQQIRAWAKSLSTTRKIGEIAKTLPKSMQADSARIQRLYTPADSALVDELYCKIKDGETYKEKYEAAQESIVTKDQTIKTLTTNSDVYKRALAGVRDALLSEAETARFLGIGRRAAMRKLAKAVGVVVSDPTQVSELENVLNGK